MDVLKLSHVAKSFGPLPVIRDLSFSVPEHAVFGFIGKNGAGKTTTMKMILGFLPPDAGHIEICGEPVNFGGAKTLRSVGYLPDVPEFYGFMAPTEYLQLCGRIAGMTQARLHTRIGELLQLTGLDGVNRRIRNFSRGMKQRLGIAQALLNEPRLLICDEPTSALDPIGRKEILDILTVAKAHTTIVFSTHILADVERICDQIGIIDQGRLTLSGKLAEIKEAYRRDTVLLQVRESAEVNRLAEKIRTLSQVFGTQVLVDTIAVQLCGTDEATAAVLTLLIRERVHLIRYEVSEPDLENVFMEAVR